MGVYSEPLEIRELLDAGPNMMRSRVELRKLTPT